MDLSEEELLADKKWLPSLQWLMYKRQFSETFLAKTVEYYDSWICLRTQHSLSPYFCFRYLYDNDTDSADNWTDYNDIERYFSKTDPHITKEDLDIAYKKAIDDRISELSKKSINR